MSENEDLMYGLWIQNAYAVGLLKAAYGFFVERAARAYGRLDEYLATADVPDDTSTSALWQARERFLGVLHDFEGLERAAKGRCGDAFDAWLEETLEAVRENEMRGRRDGRVGYHTYDLL
jgi:hypothetical protein